MTTNEPLGLGLIGCGAFGLFCLEAFSRMAEVRLVAAARARKPSARQVCRRLGVRIFADPQEVIDHDEVDVVHVATPPAFHCETAVRALEAGKHVLCEKPLGLDRAQAERMIRAARRANRFLATNFVLRYSPISEAVGRIIRSGVLGRVSAGAVVVCGSDSGLGADHWFWDKSISGGIFIEHGVHFFDLYASWLGPGQVVDARAEAREGTAQEDRAVCTVRHDDGAAVWHYYGFNQIGPMDRTEHRLIFEMGDVRAEGWVPRSLTVDAAVNDAGLDALAECCPACRVECSEQYSPDSNGAVGRKRIQQASRRIRLGYQPLPDKQKLYAECLRALLADQIAWARDPGHRRKITEDNGADSLVYAEAAARLAESKPQPAQPQD